MNDVLRPYNSFFWVLYLNEIVVYSKSLEEHVQHTPQACAGQVEGFSSTILEEGFKMLESWW